MKIAEITSAQLNETGEIQGHIVSVRDLPKGRKLVVKDGSGHIPVILWDNVIEALSQVDQFRSGSQVSVRGRISEYKGELRLVPAKAADLQLVAPADASTRKRTPLGSLASVGTGNSAWVIGVIIGMEAFSKGVKLRIRDDSGEGVILLWQNVYDSLPRQESFAIDAEVGAYGEVNHFRDEWEIVPGSKTEVTLIEKAT